MATAEVRISPGKAGWVVVGPDKQESEGYHRQHDARARARRLVQDSGGGEVVIRSRSGRIVERQTVPKAPAIFGSHGRRQLFSTARAKR
ncbi:MAG: DUF2188 domain-containing protein [Solirubrobacterales bacterium]